MQALSIKDSVSELLPLVEESATARSIVLYLAERSRHRTDTDLKRLKYDMYHAGLLVDDNEYMSFWEALSKTGKVGKLIRATTTEEPVMKRGKPVKKDGKPVIHKTQKSAKFHWTFSCKAFGIQMMSLMLADGIDLSDARMSLGRIENGGRKTQKVKKAKVSTEALKTIFPEGITKAEAKALSKKLISMAK